MWLPTASNRHYTKALQILNDSVLKIIQQRRAMSDRPVDLLTMLIDRISRALKLSRVTS